MITLRVFFFLVLCAPLYSFELVNKEKVAHLAHSPAARALFAAPSAYWITQQLKENIFTVNSIAPLLQNNLPSNETARSIIIGLPVLTANLSILHLVQSSPHMLTPALALLLIASVYKGNRVTIAANLLLATNMCVGLL